MTVLNIIIVAFAALGALDYLLGGKLLGVGKDFERAFSLLGVMSLAMIGMIVLAPVLGEWMRPLFGAFYNLFGIDPSIIPASLLANDMGGAPLATEVAKNAALGGFNAYVVAAMMGATVSYTIPFALGIVPKEKHTPLILGLLCGIITIPVGCLVSGIMLQIPFGLLLLDLLPLILLCGILAVLLLLFPAGCVKAFKIFGFFIKALVIVGLLLGITQYMTGFTPIKGLGSVTDGALVCFNAAIVMAGAFPLLSLLARLLRKPLGALGRKIGVNDASAVALIGTLATNATTFGTAEKMDDKGLMINSAFAVSAAFTLAGHLAFTLAFDGSYVPSMIVGKLTAGICALVIAFPIYKHTAKKATE